jgi:hypothetical protein
VVHSDPACSKDATVSIDMPYEKDIAIIHKKAGRALLYFAIRNIRHEIA